MRDNFLFVGIVERNDHKEKKMNQEKLEKVILAKPCVNKEFPFGDDVVVFKVKK